MDKPATVGAFPTGPDINHPNQSALATPLGYLAGILLLIGKKLFAGTIEICRKAFTVALRRASVQNGEET